jgi:SAM-dependent methyltransferase
LTPWNHNIHYHPLLLGALPHDARRVLDVGCGDGMLAADLVNHGVAEVAAIDRDAPVLERARKRHEGTPIVWIEDDFMTAPFERGSFDAVLSVATLHHLDMERALLRCADLVRPGGVVGVVGPAAFDWRDLPYELVGTVAHRALGASRGYWDHTAPTVWPPPLTYSQVRLTAERVLPGVRYRRHILWRYSLVWKKPATAPTASRPSAQELPSA